MSDNRALEIVWKLDEGDEALVTLEGLNLSLTRAPDVDLSVFIADQFDATGEAQKKRGNELNKSGQTRINHAKNLRELIKGSMVQDASKEILGLDFKWCLSPRKSKLVVTDQSKIPAAYKKAVTVYEIDEDALRQDLELGVPVEGATLEPVFALQARPNTKGKIA